MNSITKYAILFIAYTLLIGFIFISVAAQDEGTLGENPILNVLADYLFFIPYPAFLFSYILAQTGINNILYISVSIILTSIIYTTATVYLMKILKKKSKQDYI